jgi:hypothetical protein
MLSSMGLPVPMPAARELRARAAKARARADLRRTQMLLQAGVLAGWFGLALGLTSVLTAIFHYGNMFGVAAVALAMGGLLAPAAITAQRAINDELSRRRLRLCGAYRDDVDHLPPRLRALLLETRMVHSAIDVEGDGGPVSRAVWDWVRQVDALDDEERHVLDGLGLSTAAVREVIFRDTAVPSTGRPERAKLRGGLTESQQVQLGRQLGKFEETLAGLRPLPYR